jgi:diguanylate cyclase (GGDEF)-like protein
MNRERLRFAIVLDCAFSSFQDNIRIGCNRYLEQAGIDAVYFNIGNLNTLEGEDRSQLAFFDFLTAKEFDGLILLATSLVNMGGKDILKKRLRALAFLPMVSIGFSLIGEDFIAVDNRRGIVSLMDHLIRDHGYKDFAFVSGPKANPEAQVRLETFRSTLEAAGLVRGPEREFFGDFLVSSGMDAVSALLDKRGLRPEAVVCANDLMAIGVWKGLCDRGLSVPHDIAVTGYDDMPTTGIVSHMFTTVRQPVDELGYLAAKRLHSLVIGEAVSALEPLATELRVRSSCGCVEPAERMATWGKPRVDTGFSALREQLLSRRRDGFDSSERRGIYREWLEVAYKTLADRGSVYELEGMLRDVRMAAQDLGSASGLEPILATLHTLLLEESEQMDIFDRIEEGRGESNLRGAIDRLQEVMNTDLAETAHAERFAEIAQRCRAKSFFVARFINGDRPLEGASVIYATGAAEGEQDWSPGPGSWIPRRPGCFVAEMISLGLERFGYFLLDADSADPTVFGNLRVRLSQIFRDLGIMKSMRQLNSEMAREIAARGESEEKLKAALALVRQLSMEDELTQLYNRRGFLSLAELQVKFLRRQASEFLVLYADLDGLKRINDAWGHMEGDEAIRSAAKVLREVLRESDIVARLGGDEFTALVNKAPLPTFEIIRDRIAAACDKLNAGSGKPWKLSISLGHFHATSDCRLSVQSMLELADNELYRQKLEKKNLER